LRKSALFYLLSVQFSEYKRLSLQAIVIIAFLVAIATLTVGLGKGILAGVNKAREQFPPGVLTVTPKDVSISILKLSVGKIGDDNLVEIKALEGVKQVHAQMNIKIPLKAEAEFMGQQAVSDVALLGIDEELVKGDVKSPLKFTYDANDANTPIPVVLPMLFADIFNLAYAESMGFPRLNEEYVLGKHFTLYCGDSYVFGTSGETTATAFRCQIVGITKTANLVNGGYIPLSAAKYLNEKNGKDKDFYSKVFVETTPQNISAVEKKITDMGFAVESNSAVLEKIRFASQVLVGLLLVFALTVICISLMSLYNLYSSLYEARRQELGLMRCVGATRHTLTILCLSETLLRTALAGIVGGGVAFWVLRWADRSLLGMLPKISFIPESFIPLSVWDVCSIVLIMIMLCVGLVFPKIYSLGRTVPSQLMD